MTAKIATKHRLLPMCLAAALLTGCSDWDAPLAVEPIVALPAPSRQALEGQRSADGSQLTVVDVHDGTAYTLDLRTRQLRSSDGRVLFLEIEETVVAANAILATLQADSILNQFRGGPPGGCESGHPDGGCVEPMSTDTREAQVIIEVVAADGATRQGGPFGARPLPPRPQPGGSHRNDSNDVGIMSLSCAGAVESLYRMREEHLNGRTSWLRRAFTNATYGVMGSLFGGILGGAGAVFVQEGTDHFYRAVAVGVFAWYWNTYDCGNRFYVMHVGGGGSGSDGYSVDCAIETWRISTDGGRTWDSFLVKVCTYTMKQT